MKSSKMHRYLNHANFGESPLLEKHSTTNYIHKFSSRLFCLICKERQFVLRVIGKRIRRHDLCSQDIYRSKQMSFFSQRNNGEHTDSSLNLCEQKRFTKLEHVAHVIQALIKPSP